METHRPSGDGLANGKPEFLAAGDRGRKEEGGLK
jgi:hypothetical protein